MQVVPQHNVITYSVSECTSDPNLPFLNLFQHKFRGRMPVLLPSKSVHAYFQRYARHFMILKASFWKHSMNSWKREWLWWCVRDTYVDKDDRESPNNRNDRAIRAAVSWYQCHFAENGFDSYKVILLTSDKQHTKKSINQGITVYTGTADW